MKKYTLYFLLSVAGMINCQKDEAQKTSAYQDLKEIERLRSISREAFERGFQKARSVSRTISRIENDIKSEIEICEAAESCENSQKLEQLLKEYATAQFTFENVQNEMRSSQKIEEIKEIFKKYAQ